MPSCYIVLEVKDGQIGLWLRVLLRPHRVGRLLGVARRNSHQARRTHPRHDEQAVGADRGQRGLDLWTGTWKLVSGTGAYAGANAVGAYVGIIGPSYRVVLETLDRVRGAFGG